MLGGAAIMARRKMIEQVGGFDERFHMYGEDNEWCWRITKVKLAPDVCSRKRCLLHHGAQSSAKALVTQLIRYACDCGQDLTSNTSALPRWRLAANQLANYLVVTVQITGRKLLGIEHPELNVIREMHREHLKRALSNNHSHG